MKILIADPLSEKGHLNFNSNIIKWFENTPDVEINYYFSESMSNNMQLECNTFEDSLLSKENGFKYKLNQMKIINDIYKHAVANKCDKLFILSYELFSTALYFKLKKRKENLEVFLIEHNTVPTNYVKHLFYKLIPREKITHIGLMPYISRHIKYKYNKNSIFLPHPMREFDDTVNQITMYCNENVINVFMPSYVEEKLKDTICSSFETLGDNFILRTKGTDSKFKNVLKQNYFIDYDNLLVNADAIFIPQKFDYRVSGVLYEALQTEAKIFMSNCLFAQEMKERFNMRIVLVDDWGYYIRNNFISAVKNKNECTMINREAFNSLGSNIVKKELLCLR